MTFVQRLYRSARPHIEALGPRLAGLRVRFKSLSLAAKAGVVSLVAAFTAGLVGAVGEDTWQWLTTPTPPGETVAALPPEAPPRAMSDAEKHAAFERKYPGVKLDLKVNSSEDGSFDGFERNIKILTGNWQVSSGMFIGRRFTPARLAITNDRVLTARLSVAGCAATFRISKAQEGESVTLRKEAASGGWCAGAVGMVLESIVDDSVSMSVYRGDGSVNGPNILIKPFEG